MSVYRPQPPGQFPERAVSQPSRQLQEPTVWPKARIGVVLLAFLTASVTAFVAWWIGDTVWQVLGGVAFVLVTVATVDSPRAVALPVLVGVALTWSLLEGRDGAEAVVMVPVIVGVMATAELLGLASRMELIVRRDPTPDLVRVVLSAAVAAAAALVALLVGTLEGPGGFAAVALFAGTCVALAVLLFPPGPRPRNLE